MTGFNRLVEEHVRIYEAHHRQLDQRPPSEAVAEVAPQPEPALKADWETQEIESAGPMGVWDAVAIQAEHLVERMER